MSNFDLDEDFIVLFGKDSAFSSGKLSKYKSKLSDNNSFVDSLIVFPFYLIKGKLSSSSTSKLISLLGCGGSLLSSTSNVRYVVPKPGTLSPWSSKALDIIQLCGITDVQRIERGLLWQVKGEILDTEFYESVIHDRMTEAVFDSLDKTFCLFGTSKPKEAICIPVLTKGVAALCSFNISLGLSLTDEEIAYLVSSFRSLGRDPYDVELMMFSQANSEHCRHKIFNSKFIIDGQTKDRSLFSCIRRSTECSPLGVLSAYKDNASVIEGFKANLFYPKPENRVYSKRLESVHLLMKVETHNHPTAISPYSGSATGSGGELRDEGSTGKGSKPKAGLVGFSVSNLKIPGFCMSWEEDNGKPNRISSSLEIMLEAPIGAASYNNEFGRPSILGYFRTLELSLPDVIRGFHKPIMIAGGLGTIREMHVEKGKAESGSLIIVLGGPSMLIGLGGGSSSSSNSGSSSEELDFSSVQRANAEMQRRCQEVINSCSYLDEDSPIISIHDVGAGGLSNAIPELVHESGKGAFIDLKAIPSSDSSLSPLELWCNESQERYVLIINEASLELFRSICARERCPFAIVGKVTEEEKIVLSDTTSKPIDLPVSVLLGNTPKFIRETSKIHKNIPSFQEDSIDLNDAICRILSLPAVADKTFLITIGDRSVGGLVCRDQMVGPFQVPVADCAVTCSSFESYTGESMAIGERPNIAIINAKASARMAIGEALTNIASSYIYSLNKVRFSANWMASASSSGEDADLYEAVHAVGVELCPALGISIPVGKDSLSMCTTWENKSVISPVCLVATAFAPVLDIRKTLTPEIALDQGDTLLLYIDLGEGKYRLGGSSLFQVFNQVGTESPDFDNPSLFKSFFNLIQHLNSKNLLLAYHDRSDGGLFVTLLEMALAGNVGLNINLDQFSNSSISLLFSEELGVVVQIRSLDLHLVQKLVSSYELNSITHVIGHPTRDKRIRIIRNNETVIDECLYKLRDLWSQTTYHMQILRDTPDCAKEEHSKRIDPNYLGQSVKLTFDPNEDISAPFINLGLRPRIAVLREQGVNGHVEMAAAFDKAGFEAIDVHMTDLISGQISLNSFKGLVACGGFSYGDVLGAGQGWAKTILFNTRLKDEFSAFFLNKNTFALGVCNGCQMLTHLTSIIEGSQSWPTFLRNQSDQFEARLSRIRIHSSPSIFFKGMEDSEILIPVAHGEGRASFKNHYDLSGLKQNKLIVSSFIDDKGRETVSYPDNPNGSSEGICSITTPDGRITVMMPHPERAFRTVQHSWHPKEWKEDAPLLRMFRNARVWLG
jgi:phosphoribosylformylglycinamidine synthase